MAECDGGCTVQHSPLYRSIRNTERLPTSPVCLHTRLQPCHLGGTSTGLLLSVLSQESPVCLSHRSQICGENRGDGRSRHTLSVKNGKGVTLSVVLSVSLDTEATPLEQFQDRPVGTTLEALQRRRLSDPKTLSTDKRIPHRTHTPSQGTRTPQIAIPSMSVMFILSLSAGPMYGLTVCVSRGHAVE
jgi:hypothetical protein